MFLRTVRINFIKNSMHNKFQHKYFHKQLFLASGAVNKEVAKKMPKDYSHLSNDTLWIMCSAGDHQAKIERLIREIMSVDDIDWIQAKAKFKEMSAANCEGMSIATLPYKVGLVTSLTAATVSIPLTFESNSVKWFNENFVTAEVPSPNDLETWLEVGSWAWNWMEPVLGHISFFLLCLQFARSQMQNLHWRPYSAYLAEKRAERLYKRYPNYNESIVKDFARNDDFRKDF